MFFSLHVPPSRYESIHQLDSLSKNMHIISQVKPTLTISVPHAPGFQTKIQIHLGQRLAAVDVSTIKVHVLIILEVIFISIAIKFAIIIIIIITISIIPNTTPVDAVSIIIIIILMIVIIITVKPTSTSSSYSPYP
jgi:hypothetical protein